MEFNWYVFEQSYLMHIDYRLLQCSLVIRVDAKMSWDHPKAKHAAQLEQTFEEVSIQFHGVQYFRTISSKSLLHNPNEDWGSIEQFGLKSIHDCSKGLTVTTDGTRSVLSLALSEHDIVEHTTPQTLTALHFVSDYVSFELGFESYDIVLA